MADRLGLETHVLRYWEDLGLLAPARDGGGRRRYGDTDAVRLAVIVRNKQAGMSLEQIRVLLDSGTPGRHRVLEDHLAELERRMTEMERSREMTEHALRCEAHDIVNCPRFRGYVEDLVGPRQAASGALATGWSEAPDRTSP